MEFLRFGSKIPGAYWGCCAICIVQNFKIDPDTKASIQLVHGDTGYPIQHPKGGLAFVGPTYRDIFLNRIRIGTFSSSDMPNHIFLASLTESQVNNTIGKKWLAILKEAGFEFIRTTDNSVYTGPVPAGGVPHPVHLFGLFRNIGDSRIKNPFIPPKAWQDLPDPYNGASIETLLAKTGETQRVAEEQSAIQLAAWSAGKTTILSEAEIVKSGAPAILAGVAGLLPATSEHQLTARQSIVSTYQMKIANDLQALKNKAKPAGSNPSKA